MDTKQKRKFRKYLSENYSCVDSFTIFGSPARKSNSRIFIPKLKRMILGKSAMQYQSLFEKQISRLSKRETITDPNLFWVFYIYLNNKSADVSTELIFDFLEKYGIIENDVLIRDSVAIGELDYELPRVTIKIYKQKG